MEREILMDKEQQVEWARRYLVKSHQSFEVENRPGRKNVSWGYATSESSGKRESSDARATANGWHTLPYRILAASPHLQGISGHEEILDKLLESMPLLEALEIIERELG